MAQRVCGWLSWRIWANCLSIALLIAGLAPLGGRAQGSVPITRAAPSNDNFTNATELDGIYVTVQGTNIFATAEACEPDQNGSPATHSVWWKWIAPSDGEVELDTTVTFGGPLIGILPLDVISYLPIGSDPPYVFRQYSVNADVFTGDDVTNLNPVFQQSFVNYDTTNRYPTQKTRFNALAGQTYFIRVDSRSMYAFELTLICGQIGFVQPAVGAVLSAGHPVEIEFSAFDTNVQLSSIEAFVGSNSLGVVTSPPFTFFFTPTESGLAFISAVGTNALGEQVLALYRIFIVAPENDKFADATVIPGNWSDGIFSGDTTYASSEPGEPEPLTLSGRTLWWRWTPSNPGDVTFSVPSSKATVALYTGTSLDTLELAPVQCSYSGWIPVPVQPGFFPSSTCSFTPVPGATYYFCGNGGSGPFMWTLNQRTLEISPFRFRSALRWEIRFRCKPIGWPAILQRPPFSSSLGPIRIL